MQASAGITGRRQESNASRIRNVGPRMNTFLTMKEGDRYSRVPKEAASIEA